MCGQGLGVRTEATFERSSFFSCIDFILCVAVPYRLYCSKDSGTLIEAFKKGSGLFKKKKVYKSLCSMISGYMSGSVQLG